MHRWTALLVMGAGCHRLWGIDDTILQDAQRFDAPIDASCGSTTAGGADWDNDGITDDCDLCPQDPAPTIDSDGDGIGDACDPRPTQPDTRILWHGFTAANEIAGWTSTGGMWGIESTGLVQSDGTATGRLEIPGTFSDVYVETRMLILSVGATPYAGICTHVTATDYKCCDADDSAPKWALIARSATLSTTTDFGTAVASGDEIELSSLARPSHHDCTMSKGANTKTIGLTEDSGAGFPVFHVRDMAVAYQYLFVVKLGPP